MTSKVHQVQRLFRARNTRAPGPSRDLVAAVGEADGLGVVGLSREMMGELEGAVKLRLSLLLAGKGSM
jgi:hypothetical protein